MRSALKVGLLCLLSLFDPALGGKVQKSHLVLPHIARAHRDAVEKIFVTSYEAYKCVIFHRYRRVVES
jgi:hypothetical protein